MHPLYSLVKITLLLKTISHDHRLRMVVFDLHLYICPKTILEPIWVEQLLLICKVVQWKCIIYLLLTYLALHWLPKANSWNKHNNKKISINLYITYVHLKSKAINKGFEPTHMKTSFIFVCHFEHQRIIQFLQHVHVIEFEHKEYAMLGGYTM